MRVIKLFIVTIVASVVLIGCQQKVWYITPELEGQVIDRVIDEPIEGVKVVFTSKHYDYTDNTGRFFIPAIEKRHWLFGPSYNSTRAFEGASLTFEHNNYLSKSYVPSSMPWVTKLDDNTYSKKIMNIEMVRHVGMGKIYMTPIGSNIEKVVKEHHVSGPSKYCKPNQSQKEVECIPVPRSLTYEKVSPNQPLN